MVAPLLAPPSGPAAIVVHVEDNGSSGDRVAWSFVSPLSTMCPPPVTVPENAAPSGDLTVVDAQPLPTSKDQCKNCGWRNFPGFKNQGQCIRFVRIGF